MRLIYTLVLTVFVMASLATPASASPLVRVFAGGSPNYCSSGDPNLIGGGALGMSNGSILTEIGGYANSCQGNSTLFASMAVFPIQQGKWRVGLGASADYIPSGSQIVKVRPEGIIWYSLSASGSTRGRGRDRNNTYPERGILLDIRVGVRESEPYATVGFAFYFNK